MAIQIENDTIISISELAESLDTSPAYMKDAIKATNIKVLVMNRRPTQQYVALRAVHDYLMERD